MTSYFQPIDWFVLFGFLLILVGMGLVFQRNQAKSADDYFLAGHNVAPWVVAISTIATMQSAATFLGAPDFGYRGDFTYLGTNIGTIIAAIFVGKVLIPRFYDAKVSTVYELLKIRYSESAMRAAGLMFLIGRVFAEGSRIYLAAIAVSMMIFSNVSLHGIIISSFLIIFFSFMICFFGGLKSVIWTDLILFIIYIGAAIGSLFYLVNIIPANFGQILDGLQHAPNGVNKLKLIDFTFDLSKPFSIYAILTGMVLLSIASFGLDQDISQRLMASSNAKGGAKSLYMASIWTLPIVAIFICIGMLLYIFYNRPDLMGNLAQISPQNKFKGEDVTVFMFFIMTQIPPGLRALATIGVLSAAISTVNSGLNSMSSVLIQDFYRPMANKISKNSLQEAHFVNAGRWGMAFIGCLLFMMAILSYNWQKSQDIPLLSFVLGVMTFAYAGLLGVYFTAIFTKRGSTKSIIAALIIGFVSILMMQPWIANKLQYPLVMQKLAFGWQLVIGTMISTIVACIGNKPNGNILKN